MPGGETGSSVLLDKDSLLIRVKTENLLNDLERVRTFSLEWILPIGMSSFTRS